MKKILLFLTVLSVIIVLIGCGTRSQTISVNVENKDNLSDTTFGVNALVKIGGELWYDSSTRIVYWWNGFSSFSDYATTPSPYYAPNGLPYRYNPDTNTFEEIN